MNSAARRNLLIKAAAEKRFCLNSELQGRRKEYFDESGTNTAVGYSTAAIATHADGRKGPKVG